jgi:hypothetical protein
MRNTNQNNNKTKILFFHPLLARLIVSVQISATDPHTVFSTKFDFSSNMIKQNSEKKKAVKECETDNTSRLSVWSKKQQLMV